MVLVLREEDVRKVLRMRDVINAVEKGFLELGKGKVEMPQRTFLSCKKGFALIMPCSHEKFFGTKIVSVFEENPKKGLPVVLASYLLSDSETGKTLSLMDANLITALRTGAASAIATKYLAQNLETLGIFGSGTQAKSHLEAIHEIGNLKEVLVVSPNKRHLKNFVEEMRERFGLDVKSSKPEEVARCDVVVTATTSKTPVLFGKWLREKTHINAVGAYGLDARECDCEVMRKAKIVVDLKESCLREAGDIVNAIENRVLREREISELSEVILGKRIREKEKDITLFKSVGIAIQDLVVANLVYERAVKMGIGVNV